MQILATQREGRAARTRRSFLLWAFATALAAIALTMVPGHAFADEADGLGDEQTVYAIVDTSTADTDAAAGATLETEAVDTVEVVEAPAAADESEEITDTADDQQAAVVEETEPSTDIINSTDDEVIATGNEDAIDHDDITLHDNDPPADSNDSSDEKLSGDESNPSTDASDAQENNSEISADNEKSNPNADEETPASTIITDETSPASTDTSNGEVIIVNDDVDTDAIVIATENADNAVSLTATSNELVAEGDITTQALPFTIRFFFYNTLTTAPVNSKGGTFGTVGSSHDYIYGGATASSSAQLQDDSGNYVLSSDYWDYKVTVVSGANAQKMPYFFRNGYSMGNVFVRRYDYASNTDQTTNQGAEYFSQIVGGGPLSAVQGQAKQNGLYYAYVMWQKGNSKEYEFKYLPAEGSTYQDSTIQSGESGEIISLPSDANLLNGYGWFLLSDVEQKSGTLSNGKTYTYYAAKDGAKEFTTKTGTAETGYSGSDIWDIMSYEFSSTLALGNNYVDGFYNGKHGAGDPIILYAAKKSGDSYTVTYNAAHGTTPATKTQEYTSLGASTTDLAFTKDQATSNGITAPTDGDYTLLGWSRTQKAPSTTNSDSDVDIKLGASLKDIVSGGPVKGGTYTLYAVWQKASFEFEVTYDANGGTNPSAGAYSKKYSAASDAPASFSDTGIGVKTATGYTYSFKEWNTKADGSGTTISGDFTKINNNGNPTNGGKYTLYAIWNESIDTYTVKYEATNATSGSAVTQTPEVNKASTDKVPTAASLGITRTGYDFAGWATSSSATTASITAGQPMTSISSSQITSATNVTLYPVWTAKTYTVIWARHYNGGSTVANVKPTDNVYVETDVAYDSAANLLSYLSSTSYTTDGSKTPNFAVGTVEEASGQQHVFKGWYITTGNQLVWTSATAGTALASNATLQTALGTTGAVKDDNTIVIFAVWEHNGKINVNYEDNKSTIYKDGSWNTAASSWHYDSNTNWWTDQVFKDTKYTVGQGKTSPTATGYTFKEWNTLADGTGTGYAAGATIDKINTMTLYAIWEPNTVKFALDANATAGTVTMNARATMPTKQVGDVLSMSELVSATPTRSGYDFKGFSYSYKEDGKTVNVLITDTQSLNTTIYLATTDNATITLKAEWALTEYSLRFHMNPTSSSLDSENTVKFVDASDGITTRYDNHTTSVLSDGTTKIINNTKNINTEAKAIIKATYGNSKGNWYEFVGWGSSAGATSVISDTAEFIDLYNAQVAAGGAKDNTLDIYAIWKPLEIGIAYESTDTNKGTVSPPSETSVNLAYGSASGSTASPKTGYELANPSWRHADGSNISAVTSAVAKYVPTLSELRDRYLAGDRTATFKAYFTEKQYKVQVEYYLQKADGTWDNNNPDVSTDMFGTYTLRRAYGSDPTNSAIDSTFEISQNGYAGTKLEDWILTQNYGSTTTANSYLFDFDASNANGKTSLSKIEASDTANVLKLYYTQKTYNLAALYQTVDGTASGTTTTTAGVPASSTVADTPNLMLGKTSGIRWGESVSVSSPSATQHAGYSFAWSVDDVATGTAATSTAPGTSFTISLADMAKIGDGGTITLLGTFTADQFTITLNAGTNAQPSWTNSTLSGTTTTATKTVYAGQPLDSWVPDNTDATGNTYKFLGWHDDKDTAHPDSTVTVKWLREHTGWTDNESYTALWEKKTAVAYSVGDPDTHGNSKAGWTGNSKNITDSISATLVVSNSTGKFEDIVGAGFLDANGDPIGAKDSNGNILWVFDYWEISGNDTHNGEKVGHFRNIQGSVAGATNMYLTAEQGTSSAVPIAADVIFIAHWKPVDQTVTISGDAKVKNNAAAYTYGSVDFTVAPASSSVTYGTFTSGFGYDDEINLADYQPAAQSGYSTFLGWTTTAPTDTTAGSYKPTIDYAPTAKFNVPAGGISLYPVFDEDFFTIEYEIADDSTGAGTIDLGTDTVYAVALNSINAHTATASNTDKHEFAGWTLDADPAVTRANVATTTFASTSATFTPNLAKPLTANHTYYAHWLVKQYTIKFNVDGYDGTNNVVMPQTASWNAAEATGSNMVNGNGLKLDYDATIASSDVTVNVPMGYVLSGWVVDGTIVDGGVSSSDKKTWGTPTAANLQGLLGAFTVDGNHTLTPYFTVDTVAGFTVNYNYGVAPSTGHTTSRSVIWTEDARPNVSTDATPKTPGYDFVDWYIDSAMTIAASGTGTDQFCEIYVHPQADVDTANKAITLYAKWTPKKFTVAYDLEGNVAYTSGSATASPATLESVQVEWNDKAGSFIPTTTITRDGYTLSGWTSSVVAAGVQKATTPGSIVGTNDTYGLLADNYNDKYDTVTLHAVWAAMQYSVVYKDVYGGGETYTAWHGYDEDVDYALGYAPTTQSSVPTHGAGTHDFGGWAVSFTVKNADGTTTPGSPAFAIINMNDGAINNHQLTSIKAMVADVAGAQDVTLTAIWTLKSAYNFNDVLVHRDGSEDVRQSVGPNPITSPYEVKIDSYTWPTTPYDGYDFDNYQTVLSTHPAHTEKQMSVTPGDMNFPYNVYYIERAYDIDFFLAKSDLGGTANYSTSDNPWESAKVSVPNTGGTAIVPTKTGYTFKGWFIDVNGTPVSLTNSDGSLRSIKDIMGSAPDAGTTLKAYADWDEDKATISWTTDGNGSVNPAAGSVTLDVTDTTTAVPTIKATPAANYEFVNWTYSYVDKAGKTQTGTVNASSPFATLGGWDSATSKFTELTPQQWAMGTDTDAIWHTITFTANFIASGTPTVTVKHYVENPKTGDWDLTTTTHTATKGQAYTAQPDTNITSSGYTLTPGISTSYGAYKDTDTVDPDKPSTLEYILYYTADAHQVRYEYVLAVDGTTPTTAPTGAAALPATQTKKTGEDFTVAAVPAALAGYTFTGWFLSPNYGGSNTTYDGSTYTMGANDLLFVGTWVRNTYTVHFGNTDTSKGSVIEPSVGFTVNENDTLSSIAPTIAALPVTVTPNSGQTLSGWEVWEGGTQKPSIGADAPMSYMIVADTTFKAIWARTWDVQYSRGDHGAFTSQDGSKNYVEFEGLDSNENFPAFNGTPRDGSGNPAADAGWEWVGWGELDGSGNWIYYFAYDSDVDYGAAGDPGTYAAATLPAQVTRDYKLVGFYKAVANTLKFADTEADGNIWDLDSDNVNDVQKTLADAAYTMTVKTGETPQLLDASSLKREGYTLKQWKYVNGTSVTYYDVNSTQFTMPGLAAGSVVTLYPVWSLDQLTITYDVDPANATAGDLWGGVSSKSDSKAVESDTINGSTASAKPGYEFKYWYDAADSAKTPLTAAGGLQADGKTLKPNRSGNFLAYFEQKLYSYTKETGIDASDPNKIYENTSDSSDANNWSNIAPADATNQVWTAPVTLGTPKRTGFKFDGWDVYGVESDGTTRTKLNTLPAGAYHVSDLSNTLGEYTTIVLVATWADLTYDVTVRAYDGTGSNNVQIDVDPYPYGSLPQTITNVAWTYEVQLPTLSRPGYTFAGWANDVVTTWDYTTDGLHYYELVGGDGEKYNVTLTALWTPNPVYNVTYSDGSHAGSNFTGTLPTDRTGIGFDTTNIERTDLSGGVAGYTFAGWEITNTADGTVLDTVTSGYGIDAVYSAIVGGDATITGITFTALWTGDKQYVQYHLTNGSWNNTNTSVSWPDAGQATPDAQLEYTTGATVDLRLANTVSYEGYQLKGWATKPSSTDTGYREYLFATDTDFTMPAGNVDLYPLWEPAKFEIKFVEKPSTDADTTGTYPVTINNADNSAVEYAETLTLATPTRDGHVFTGWNVYKTDEYATSKEAATALATGLGSCDPTYVANYTTTYGTLAGSASVLSLTLVATWEPAGNYVLYVVNHADGVDWVAGKITDAGQANPDVSFAAKTGATVDLRQADSVSYKGHELLGWNAYYYDNTTTPHTQTFWKKFDLNVANPPANFTMPAASLLFEPIWGDKTYEVKFDKGLDRVTLPAGVTDVDGGIMPPDTTGVKWYDYVSASKPGLAGYTWTAWEVYGSDGTLIKTTTDQNPQFNALADNLDLANRDVLTLKAVWSMNKLYNVTYKDGVKAGETTAVTALPTDQTGIGYVDDVKHSTPTRKGYTFGGWTVEATDKDGNAATPAQATLAAGTDPTRFDAIAGNLDIRDLVLTAVWTPVAVTVTFDANYTGAAAIADWSGIYADDATIAADPVRAGYIFRGWHDAANTADAESVDVAAGAGSVAYDTLAGGDPSVTKVDLVALWEKISYTIVFDTNGGDPATIADLTDLAYDDTGIALPTAPTKTGYDFAGWETDAAAGTDPAANATTVDYAAIAGAPTVTTVKLTATWTAKSGYKVTYVDKRASDTGATPVDAASMPANIPSINWGDSFGAVAPTRNGYDFDHWAVEGIRTRADGTTVKVPVGQAPARITYYYNGDKNADGTYRGLAVDLTTGLADDTITELVLTAVWTAHTHDVTYHLTDTTTGSWVSTAPSWPDTGAATPDAAITYATDATVTLRDAATVTIAGKKLVGWANGTDETAAGYKSYLFSAGETSFTMGDADVDLYPLFEDKAYTVVFDGNKPEDATDALQVVTIYQANPQTGLAWDGTVDTTAAYLPGYNFLGWRIADATGTGANTDLLTDASYVFSALALTDTADHETLTLVAIWEASTYRLIYVDDTPEFGGAALSTQISNDDDLLWGDSVSLDDPWTLVDPAYTGKDAAEWAFEGWALVDATSGARVTVAATDELTFAALAARAGLTVADIATSSDTPALTLYAVWTRRVPFVVDFVTVDADGTTTIESSVDLTGLDQDEIATVWAAYVLGLGSAHHIAGYEFDAATSAATAEITTGILDAATQLVVAGGNPLHLVLSYTQLRDYLVTYDGQGGFYGPAADGVTIRSDEAPAWNSVAADFAPVSADWHRTGYTLDHWYYVAADGSQVVFDATSGLSFGQIAAAIYNTASYTVDGSEGRLGADGTIARPVTLYAAWTLRNDYVVSYEDGYDKADATTEAGAILPKFYDSTIVGTDPAKPADRTGLGANSSDLEPESTSEIVNPGAIAGDGTKLDLYEIAGWDYYAADGTRKDSAGKTLVEIARDIWGDDEPADATITLFARWQEVKIELKYTSVVATVDANGNVVSIATGNSAGGTVSRASETISAVTGTAQGSTAQANPGYHFVGWQRQNADGTTTTIYAPDWDPTAVVRRARLSAASVNYLFALAASTGANEIDLSTLDDATIEVAQNATDEYWHEETYYALFAQNDPATLHYDKNAEDAEGEIPDVTEPYGTLLTLSDGSGFTRANWHIVSWNTEADGTGTSYKLSETGWALPEGETTLYAIWAKDAASLVYDANGGTGAPENYTGVWGDEVTVGTAVPKRTGYTFTGWLGSDGEYYEAGTSFELVPGGVTLTAQWEKNTYEVGTGEPEGGHGTVTGGPVTIEWGEHLPEGTLVATPEDGYRVSGWTYVLIDDDGNVTTGVVSDPSELTITGRVTFTPIFEKIEAKGEGEDATVAARAMAVAGTLPQTGDESGAGVAGLAGAGAVLVLLALVLRRRRDEDEAA